MKFAMLKAAAAAVLACLSTAAMAGGPGWEFKEGGAVLTFTENSLAALNTAGVTVAGAAPATFDGAKITMTSTNDLVTWNDTFDLTSLTGLGGFVLTSSTTPGARVDLTNVTMEPTGNVYADVVTQSFTSRFGNYTGRSVERMHLYTSTLAGQTNIQAGNGALDATLSDLTLASGAIPILGDALGVPSFIQTALFPTLNFGQVQLTGSFTPAIPEPSTIVLHGFGLAAVGLLLRKRRSRQETPQAQPA